MTMLWRGGRMFCNPNRGEGLVIPTARIEDYLEAVFDEEVRGGSPTVTRLAERLSVTKGTVVPALKKLVEEGLLDHERYGTPSLTEAGRQKALTIYRRHQILSFLFGEVLGIRRDHAVNLACELEHLLDENSEARLFLLTDYLGKGLREGAPWMEELQARLNDPVRLPRPLTMGESGSRYRVVRVTAEGVLRKRLLEQGFVPGTLLVHRGFSPLGDPLDVEIRGGRLALRRSEAATVWVESEEAEG